MISSDRDNLFGFVRSQPAGGRGFSLVEIIIMVGVLAIAMAIVVPLLGSTNYSVSRAGARRLASDMQYAQELAISSQEDITVTFDVSRETYWLSNESGVLNHPISNSAYTVDFRSIDRLSHLDIVESSGGASVTFDPVGVPDVESTIVLTAGESSFYVTVSDVTGTVSVTAGD